MRNQNKHRVEKLPALESHRAKQTYNQPAITTLQSADSESPTPTPVFGLGNRMSDSQNPEFELASSAPVQSLRSRFEQLALDDSSWSAPRRPTTGTLLAPESGSPRTRVVSGPNGSSIEKRPLRSTSSSSDLKSPLKRPPPPPPPRSLRSSSRNPSPSRSPILLPVLAPSNVTSNGSISRPVPPIPLSESPSSSPPTSCVEKPLLVPTNSSVTSLRSMVSLNHGTSSGRFDQSTSDSQPTKPRKPSPNSSMLSLNSDAKENLGTRDALVDDGDNDSSGTEFTLSPSPHPPALPARRFTAAPYGQSSDSSAGNVEILNDSSVLSRLYSRPVPAPPVNRSRPPGLAPLPSSSDTALASPQPPRLPLRRNTSTVLESDGKPALPSRPLSSSFALSPNPEKPNLIQKKPLSALPPPPTRTIGLGQKLPQPRRPASPSSSDEEADEEDTKTHIELLPDASNSSRSPPVFHYSYPPSKIQVLPYSGHVAISGSNVVSATTHHIKIYNLAQSEAPFFSIDTKEYRFKDAKITSMEFRPASRPEDQGEFLWFGTKDGNLFEVDIRTGCMVSSKPAAHSHPITHILRFARSMITMDDNGKVLIFTPDPIDRGEVKLGVTQPRVFRIPDKQDFAKVFGGKLWSATRVDVHGPWKTAVVRVHDLFAPGSASGSVHPSEQVGAVTSGTILPTQPNHVYLGHEGGVVTVWSTNSPQSWPTCVDVIKVSASDVLSLEGVNDRLWAGSRNGLITAYDVSAKPWVVTNKWMAHSDLPILNIIADPLSIEKSGRLCVASVGRDEQVRLWDGLLGTDWIGQELIKREASFSRFRELTVTIISWNCDSQRPDSLTGDEANINFLRDALRSTPDPDIIVFGFQEVVDLENRKMAAKSVLLGRRGKAEDGGISEKVTGAYRRWHDSLLMAVKLAMPPEAPYSVIHTENLIGLFSCIFVKNTEKAMLKNAHIKTIKRGMGGRYGNKGAIVARFEVEDSSICFINCHLAAGQHHTKQRNSDIAAILEEKAVFPGSVSFEEPLAYVGGGDGSMILDHEIVFVNGDLNYRIDQKRDTIVSAVRMGDLDFLYSHDQLQKEMRFNRGFRLRTFHEGKLTFPPTYKYDPRSSEYDSSDKRRSPAWCDRILYKARVPSRVKLLHYRRYEANVSDHRPISAGVTVTVKSVKQDLRAQVKREVEGLWAVQQQHLLDRARVFYKKTFQIGYASYDGPGLSG